MSWLEFSIFPYGIPSGQFCLLRLACLLAGMATEGQANNYQSHNFQTAITTKRKMTAAFGDVEIRF